MTDTAVAATETAAPTAAQKFSAEVLGTFVLVFFGVGAALATGGDVITTGLAFGLTVLVMAYSVGRVSGGHFNPAVTVGAAVGGRLAWSHVPLYVVAPAARRDRRRRGPVERLPGHPGLQLRGQASARTPSATCRPTGWPGGRPSSSRP